MSETATTVANIRSKPLGIRKDGHILTQGHVLVKCLFDGSFETDESLFTQKRNSLKIILVILV